MKLIDRRGDPIKYGVLLDPNKAFSKAYPVIAEGLRCCNRRRNNLLEAHPYKRDSKKTTWLQKKEQDEIVKKLRAAYKEMVIS